MSLAEAASFLKRWDFHPDPEADPEWIKTSEAYQSGDQLRLVSCKSGDYFLALTRNDLIILKYQIPILD